MPDPIIDRDAIIEKAARKSFVDANGASGIDWEDVDQRGWIADAASMLPSIADDLLAPIEAMHYETPETGKCAECSAAPYSIHSVRWPCPTAQAVAAIREAVRA